MCHAIKFRPRRALRPEVVEQRLLEILPVDQSTWKSELSMYGTVWTMLGGGNNFGFRHIMEEPGSYALWSREELPRDFDEALAFLI